MKRGSAPQPPVAPGSGTGPSTGPQPNMAPPVAPTKPEGPSLRERLARHVALPVGRIALKARERYYRNEANRFTEKSNKEAARAVAAASMVGALGVREFRASIRAEKARREATHSRTRAHGSAASTGAIAVPVIKERDADGKPIMRDKQGRVVDITPRRTVKQPAIGLTSNGDPVLLGYQNTFDQNGNALFHDNDDPTVATVGLGGRKSTPKVGDYNLTFAGVASQEPVTPRQLRQRRRVALRQIANGADPATALTHARNRNRGHNHIHPHVGDLFTASRVNGRQADRADAAVVRAANRHDEKFRKRSTKFQRRSQNTERIANNNEAEIKNSRDRARASRVRSQKLKNEANKHSQAMGAYRQDKREYKADRKAYNAQQKATPPQPTTP